MSDRGRSRHLHPHAFAGLNPLEREGDKQSLTPTEEEVLTKWGSAISSYPC